MDTCGHSWTLVDFCPWMSYFFGNRMKRILYLGLDPTHCRANGHLIHCPVIEIRARSPEEPDIQQALNDLAEYTHLLITSKSALKMLLEMLPHFGLTQTALQGKRFIAVGMATAKYIQEQGFLVESVANEESSEGLIKEILGHLRGSSYLFWPHSAQSRTVIKDFLGRQPYRYQECLLYDTVPKAPERPIDLADIDEIIFTSPSTVEAFIRFFGPLPQNKILTPIGPITQAALKKP